MYIEEKKSSAFGLILAGFDYVFLDTCSLMEEEFPEFMELLWNSKDYWKNSVHIVLLSAVLHELEKKEEDTNPVTRIGAIRALKILKADAARGGSKLLEHEKKNKATFADNAIYNYVNEYRLEKRILVVTQDRKLARDLLHLNQMESQHGQLVSVYSLKSGGEISPIKDALSNKETIHNPSSQGKSKKPNLSKELSLILKKDQELFLMRKEGNEKKIFSLVSTQIKRLQSISKEETSLLNLHYSFSKLMEWKKNLETSLLKVKPSLSLQKRNNEGSFAKISRPIDAKRSTLIPVKNPVKEIRVGDKISSSIHAAFYSGSTLEEAIRKAISENHVILRADEIAYVPMIHGPYDLTEGNLKDALKNFTLPAGIEKELLIHNVIFHVKKVQTYFASLDGLKKKEEAPKKKIRPTSRPKKEESEALKEAKRFEFILMANLSNPKVTGERKKKDLLEQIARLRKLKPSERSKLKMGIHLLQQENKKIEEK